MKEIGFRLEIPTYRVAGMFAAILTIFGTLLWRHIPDLAGAMLGLGMGIIVYNLSKIFLDKVSIGFAKFCRYALIALHLLVVLAILLYVKEPHDALGKFAHNAIFMLSFTTGGWLMMLTPSYFKRRDEYEKAQTKEIDKEADKKG